MHKKEIFLEIDANLHQPIQSMEADSNSRAIRFYLTSNYAPLNLKDKKVIFKAVKPDSTDIVNDCEIIDVEKGIVETKVTKQLNAVPGRVNCQLSIIGVNDYVLKTKKFGILVDSKLTESGIISSREYKTLENALSEVHEINKNFEQVNAKINEVATKGTTVEVIEEVTKEEIERQIADGTIAHLMIEDGSVTPEKTSFYDEIATQKNILKNAEFDYMGNNQNTVKKAIDSSIDWVLGEVNTAHHEGQHITATDTIEGHAKSAILKGQTLLVDELGNECEIPNSPKITIGAWINTNTGEETASETSFNTGFLKCPTVPFIVKGNNKYKRIVFYDVNKTFISGIDTKAPNNSDITIDSTKIPSNAFYLRISASIYADDVSYTPDTKLLIEDMSGNNLYSTQLMSVKLPGLTTTGKNLFDKEGFYNDWKGKKENYVYKEFVDGEEVLKIHNLDQLSDDAKGFKIPVKKGAPLTFSLKCKKAGTNNTSMVLMIRHDDSSYVSVGACSSDKWVERKVTFTPTRDYITVCSAYNANEYFYIKDIQLEHGTTATAYEDHKTNILTVNEDIELRGIGDVQDELDCLTGEVTERIGEVVLDGSEDWIINTLAVNNKVITFYGRIISDAKVIPNVVNYTSDKIASLRNEFWASDEVEGFMFMNNKQLAIKIKRETASTSKELVTYLSQNPITIQYQLATESIKTVDLSDNHVYSYKDVTHYDCSSAEGSLVPTLSIDVPTNLPAVVARQRVTIQELEKENVALKNEIEETANSSVNGDLELMSSQFELDFRLFEIEMNLDMPMMAMMRGVKSMAMTVYQQAKTLILAGKYEREDMEYKLNRYEAAGRITVEEYEELIALMDARELVD